MAIRKTYKQPQPVWILSEDGGWRPGFLFAWERPTGGEWTAEVSYRAEDRAIASAKLSADRVRVGATCPGLPVRPGTTEPEAGQGGS